VNLHFNTDSFTELDRTIILTALGVNLGLCGDCAADLVSPEQKPAEPELQSFEVASAVEVLSLLTVPTSARGEVRKLYEFMSTHTGTKFLGSVLAQVTGVADHYVVAGFHSGIVNRARKLGLTPPIRTEYNEDGLAVYWMDPEVAELFKPVLNSA
jgi:hypothetical protein